MDAATRLQHVLVVMALGLYMAVKITPHYVTATSDLDNVRHMFPGVYNNKLQYDHDKAVNTSQSQIHPWLNVNISLWEKNQTNTTVYFLFRATDPHVKSFNVEKIFRVQNFNFGRLLLFTVYHRVIGKTGEITAVEDLRDTNQCDMLWHRSVYGSYRNLRMMPCQVDGVDDQVPQVLYLQGARSKDPVIVLLRK